MIKQVYKNNLLPWFCRTVLYLLTSACFLSGCASGRPPAEFFFANGIVKSLSSNVSLSYSRSDRSISGSGILMFRKPDHIRAVILSPFGSVLQEVHIKGDLVTVIDPGNGVAFSGSYLDLPDTGDFSGWRYVPWLIDIDPPDASRKSMVIERVNRNGQKERAAFENGLLTSKMIVAGGSVKYGKYTTIRGVALPLEIVYETVTNEKFTILLDDPEINLSFDDSTFTPGLSRLRVFPLSNLK